MVSDWCSPLKQIPSYSNVHLVHLCANLTIFQMNWTSLGAQVKVDSTCVSQVYDFKPEILRMYQVAAVHNSKASYT